MAFLLASISKITGKASTQHCGKHLTARMKSDELVKLTVGAKQLSPHEG